MLSRIAFLRIVGVIAVLTVGGVAGAKMRHHSGSVASDIQLAAAIAPADASAATAGAEISGHAMFPLGVARGIPSYSESHAAATHAAVVDHLPDLDQLRTSGRSPAIVFGPGANSRAGGSSSAFGGHGFAGGGASFGSIGMGGGRAPQTSSKTSAPAAVKTTPAPKAPSAPAPRAPSAAPTAPPVAAAIPPAIVPPAVAAPSLTAPAVVAPPIFATETTPIPVIAGDPPKTDPAPLTGPAGGGGSVAAKGPNLSPTPEPASLLLIATGLAVVIGASRRRQTTKP